MMHITIYFLVYIFVTFVDGLNITSYSKVSKWSPEYVPNDARSAGQSFYTQSSDASFGSKSSNIHRGNINSHKIISNHNRLNKKHDVIEKRFNPPVYFGSSENDYSKPSIVYSSPGDTSQPIYSQSDNSKPNSYDSPISSYYPAPSGIPKDSNPPDPILSTKNIGGNPDVSYSYSNLNDNFDNVGYSSKPKTHKFPSYVYEHPMKDEKATTNKYLGPYAPSHVDSNEDVESDMSSTSKEVDPPDNYKEHFHSDENMFSFTVKDGLTPDTSDYGNSFPKSIPEYLDHNPYESSYGFDHSPHHVYHQITTTTSAPEDERVNKGHYSYYYLGRKLWYIPLYFSIYFIIYITVLILKSIARHKVTFAHDLHDVAHQRSLNNNLLNESTNQVFNSIGKFKNKYIAM